MRSLIIAIVFIFCGIANALEIQTDKVAHFGVGYLTSDIVHEITRDDVLSILTVAIVASIKEVTDAHWDWQDFGYTMAGAGLNITIKF